jgi:hypothetical protein
MSDQPKIRDTEVSIDIQELLGPLGYQSIEDVRPSIMNDIIAEVDRCRGMIKGRMIYICRKFRRSSVPNAIAVNGLTITDKTLVSSLDDATSFAVAVCTIGPAIDKHIEDCFSRGDFLTGMIADVTGNRAVEDVARTCARHICAEARELNLFTAAQLSPGYGTWDTSGQKPVFAILDPSPIGVSLNEYCMMDPKKSVSFVVPFLEGESYHEEKPPCHGCNFRNCSYRRT